MMKPIVSIQLVLILAILSANAEHPTISIADPSKANWNSLETELVSSVVASELEWTQTWLVDKPAVVRPVFLGVVVNPGSPIKVYGAGLIEIGLFSVTGAGKDGKQGSSLLLLIRSPFEDRAWRLVTREDFDDPKLFSHLGLIEKRDFPLSRDQAGDVFSGLLGITDGLFGQSSVLIACVLFPQSKHRVLDFEVTMEWIEGLR